MAESFWTKALPWLIAGGSTVAGAVIGSRAAGKATDAQTKATEEAIKAQAEANRQAMELQKQMYNRGVKANYPWLQSGTLSLGKLNKGMGLPMEAWDVKPPTQEELMLPAGGFGTGGDGAAAPGGDLQGPLLAAAAGGNRSTVASRAGGRVAGLAGTGATIGSFAGPVGTAVGAGVGALVGGVSSLIGKGRKEADQITPYQNALVDQFSAAINGIKDKEAAGGTNTPEDWQRIISQLTPLYNEFLDLTNNFGRAGPQAQQTVEYLGNMLKEWQQYAQPQARMHGGPAMGGKRDVVGEKGPEILEMAPGSDGFVYPNKMMHRVTQMERKMLPGRQTGGPVGGGFLTWDKLNEQQRKQLSPWMQSEISSKSNLAYDPTSNRYSDLSQAPGNWTQLGDQGSGMGPYAGVTDIPGGMNAADLVGQYPGYADYLKTSGITPESALAWKPPEQTMELSRESEMSPTGGPVPGINYSSTGMTPAEGGYGVSGQQPINTVSQLPGGPLGGAPNVDKNIITQWGWYDMGNGQWANPKEGATGHWTETGLFVNDTVGKFFDPKTGQVMDIPAGAKSPGGTSDDYYRGLKPPYDVGEGEFMRPYQGEFTGDVNQRPFEFNTEDLYKDPGYQFRLSEGEKAIERSAAARGMLQSGRTLKELERYGQGVASQEFENAYSRAFGENIVGYGRDVDQYNRAWQQYQDDYSKYRTNQSDRYNRITDMAGIGQGAAGQAGGSATGIGRSLADLIQSGGLNESNLRQQLAAAVAAGDIANANLIMSLLSNLGTLAIGATA